MQKKSQNQVRSAD